MVSTYNYYFLVNTTEKLFSYFSWVRVFNPAKNKTTTSQEIARMHTPHHIHANLHLWLFTADRTIRGAGRLADFQANAPTASFTIFFLNCLAFVSNSFTNYIITIFVSSIMTCIFVVTKRVKTDMKICQCNAKPKDVIVPFLHPPILCWNYTPQFCKMTKKIFNNYTVACNWCIPCVHPQRVIFHEVVTPRGLTLSSFVVCSSSMFFSMHFFIHMYHTSQLLSGYLVERGGWLGGCLGHLVFTVMIVSILKNIQLLRNRTVVRR